MLLRGSSVTERLRLPGTLCGRTKSHLLVAVSQWWTKQSRHHQRAYQAPRRASAREAKRLADVALGEGTGIEEDGPAMLVVTLAMLGGLKSAMTRPQSI